ncbi:FecR family protein [Brevundimonas sp. SL130]|uniref:FecR family protein n=1 Tax=Brevundimonas sp. SL130 TaxID=2995143 RepID=UPI00226CEFDE|nr:FecR family protein [Brevundimonas sp. SL130]WAC61492.1 FecR family protein [Brevundimonas sp. SL130]
MTSASNIPDRTALDPETVERTDREATDWLILLQDNPDDVEVRARFETWLSACPDNGAAWSETQWVVGLIDATPPAHRAYWSDIAAPDPAATLQPRSSRRARPAVFRRAWSQRALVAVMSAAACVAILAGPNVLLYLRSDYVSGLGEMRTVQMQDGSVARLAPGSAIKIAYADGRRDVRLLKGLAYFEVQRDPARPFRVEAGEVETTVLGTGFEVGRNGQGVDVAVRHGLVRVDRSKGAVISTRLSAGDRIRVMPQGTELSRMRPDKVAAWTHGDLIVNDQPIRDVVDAVRPWYDGVILTTGDRLNKQRVTGVYDLHDPMAALTALGQAHDLKVRRISPWIMVVSAN